MNPADVAQGDANWQAYLAAEPRLRRRTWECWRGMRRRAGNRGGSWPSYAAVGVCPAWEESFRVFVEHLGHCPSLEHTLGRHRDRGDYRPGNVAWQSSEEQADHRARCRWHEIDGESRSLRAWAEARDVAFGRLLWRVTQGGQPIEEALDELERLREQGKAPGYLESRTAYLAMRARRRERERLAGRTCHRPGQTATRSGSGAGSGGGPPSHT